MSISISTSRSHRFSTSAISQEPRGHKIFEGYLSKKGKVNKALQTRWFVLYSNNTLSYYQDPTATYEAPLGNINLYSVLELKEDSNDHQIFKLVTPKRTFELKCEVNDELDQWLKKLKLRVSPNIVCKGWLYKKGEKRKAWKERYFLLCEYEMHYEVRYYENEQRSKYKNKINCDYIDDIKILPDSSIKQYGKDKVIELITESRTYVIAAKDIKSRNMWYKAFKKVLFGEDIDKKNEEQKLKQQKVKESVNNMKIFDSLQSSMKETEKVQSETPKDTIIKHQSIFVEKVQKKELIELGGVTPVKSEENMERNVYSQSFAPFVEKDSYSKPIKKESNIQSIDDEKEIESENITNTFAGTENDGFESMNDTMTTNDGSTNPFFVETNQSMQTENRFDLMNSLGSVSSVNAINDSDMNGHHPLVPDPHTSLTQTNTETNNPFIHDSMYDESGPNTKSVVYGDKFMGTDYEEAGYARLIENDRQIIEVSDPDANKCCRQCVVL